MSQKDISQRPRIVLINRAFILNNKKILLIQRIKDDSYCPEKWEAPGGKLDHNQDISEGLEREVLEETNLVIVPVSRIAYYDTKILSTGKYKGIACVVFFGIVKKVAGTVKISNEHQAFSWVSVQEAYDYDLTPETRKALMVLEEKILAEIT